MNTIEELYTEISAELTVMSPVFIGSGEELNKTKYYFNQSDMTVKIVDEKKFRQFLAKRNLFESFQSHLLQCNDRGRNIGNLSRWLKENNLMPDGIDIWKYTLKAKNIRKKDEKRDKSIQLNDIKAFIKNANGKPYIPGSSLKGAIRTALLYLEITENKEKYSQFWNELKGLVDGREIGKKLQEVISRVEKQAYGDIQESKFRAVRVSDSKEAELSNLYIGQRSDFPIHKKKTSVMPVCLEFLGIGTKLKFTIDIDETVNRGYFTKEKIEKALTEFAKFQNKLYAEFSKKDIENIFMPEEINEDTEPNMCLGGQSGFWSKTVIYALAPDIQSGVNLLRPFFASQFDRQKMNHKHNELDKNIAPHAMKLAEDNGEYIPIGWCDLKLRR